MPCNGIFKFNQYGEKACLRKSGKAVLEIRVRKISQTAFCYVKKKDCVFRTLHAFCGRFR
jgi:hypothetical protein